MKNDMFEVDENTSVQTLKNCLYNGLHYPEREGFLGQKDAHYKEIVPGKYVRIPWATEIEPMVEYYVEKGVMPCSGLRINNEVAAVKIVGFYNNDVENNVVVEDLDTEKRFEVPVEQILLGWLQAGWYQERVITTAVMTNLQ